MHAIRPARSRCSPARGSPRAGWCPQSQALAPQARGRTDRPLGVDDNAVDPGEAQQTSYAVAKLSYAGHDHVATKFSAKRRAPASGSTLAFVAMAESWLVRTAIRKVFEEGKGAEQGEPPFPWIRRPELFFAKRRLCPQGDPGQELSLVVSGGVLSEQDHRR